MQIWARRAVQRSSTNYPYSVDPTFCRCPEYHALYILCFFAGHRGVARPSEVAEVAGAFDVMWGKGARVAFRVSTHGGCRNSNSPSLTALPLRVRVRPLRYMIRDAGIDLIESTVEQSGGLQVWPVAGIASRGRPPSEVHTSQVIRKPPKYRRPSQRGSSSDDGNINHNRIHRTASRDRVHQRKMANVETRKPDICARQCAHDKSHLSTGQGC